MSEEEKLSARRFSLLESTARHVVASTTAIAKSERLLERAVALHSKSLRIVDEFRFELLRAG
jgi:hypothetical protein